MNLKFVEAGYHKYCHTLSDDNHINASCLSLCHQHQPPMNYSEVNFRQGTAEMNKTWVYPDLDEM